MTRLETVNVVQVAANNGTSAMVTREGEVLLFGKDSVHADFTTGVVGELKGTVITQVSDFLTVSFCKLCWFRGNRSSWKTTLTSNLTLTSTLGNERTGKMESFFLQCVYSSANFCLHKISLRQLISYHLALNWFHSLTG